MNKDVCYCAETCDRTGCFRNRCHIEPGIVTLSYLRQSEACPKNRGYYGSISDEMLKNIPQKFASDFLKELQAVFRRREPLSEDELFDCAGTNGWQKAFESVCAKHSLNMLVEHAEKLDWQEYDIFTAELNILCVYWRWANNDRAD